MESLRSRTALYLGLLLGLLAGPRLPAITTDDLCPVCHEHYGPTVYGLTKRGRTEKVFVCANCAKLETRCYICAMPVKDKFLRLADGRLLCDEDARQCVLEQFDAEKLFDDVKRETQTVLTQLGSLPNHNIKLILEAKARLDKSGPNVISTHDDRLLMGVTRTTGFEEGKFEHTISLLYGLTKERMTVVAAHEYAHTWLHENVRRKLNQDTVEGFCDWIAHKIIAPKNAYETEVLMKSEYSQGQLQAFLAAEKEHTFYHVMQWVKAGVDPEVDLEHLERILVLRDQKTAPAAPLVFTTPAPPRPAPATLVLKGLSGTKTRRFALINDATFAANEQGKVRLGESNVVVRCLEIRDDAVVVQIAGVPEPQTLKLINGAKP